MRVSAVVPCRNEATTIDRLLGALAAQSSPPDEVILVDDGSRDATAARALSWKSRLPMPLHVVTGPGRGVAAALNVGIRRASGELIARFDGHSWPAPAYLSRALSAFATESSLGVVGGVWRIEPVDPAAVAHAIAAVVAHPLGSGGVAYRHVAPATAVDVDTVPFGVFRRTLWESLGGYDERLGANEDFDFNARVREAGLRVVLQPGMTSTYIPRQTLPALAKQYVRYGFWKHQALRKAPSTLRWRQLPPILCLPMLLASVAAGLAGASIAWSVPALYGTALLLAATQLTARRRRLALLVPAVAAFAVIHLAWSGGWWAGAFTRRQA